MICWTWRQNVARGSAVNLQLNIDKANPQNQSANLIDDLQQEMLNLSNYVHWYIVDLRHMSSCQPWTYVITNACNT